MRFPNIDQYVSKFKELACQTGYTAGNTETIYTFTKGLTQSIMEDVLKPPYIHNYQEIKQKVIKSTRSHLFINQIIWSCNPGGGNSGFHRGAFREFWNNAQGQRHPLFSQNNNQSNRPQRPPQGGYQQYNSSNTLCQYNNQPIPMDLDRTRAPYWHSGGRGSF